MKKLLAFTIAAGLTLSLFAADVFKYAPVTGNVKSYTETDFSIATRFGTLYRTPSSKIMHVFDSNGKEISSSDEYLYGNGGNVHRAGQLSGCTVLSGNVG